MRTTAAITIVLAGCGTFSDDAPFAAKLVAVHDRMHARFAASQRVERAIALGDLERARAEARTIARLDEPDVLPEWQPHFRSIEAAAREVDASRDLVAAARATARLGQVCAGCHEATSAKIVLDHDPAPSAERGLAAKMASHGWAAARMWDGLVTRSDDRWLAGARVLATADLTIAAENDELGIANDLARMKLFATRAQTARPAMRAEVYGDLLATCAHCHYAIRGR
jgi:hypothetical protein